ncbi:archaeal flagellar protein FlaJ [Nanobdella aerobiophila]|uniref:Archaeal flagellar protein FlaJ n=1 Tax=Nanobdella aerobiophila TaxID=2586965 RepID=A0A915WRT8_9ARCH|nr:type II secretion system F family protein [Nanobdella aerobiophila]BBL45594.1 archaeal flagellar protein FlaJ [Nanobdella aerobiophila]
MPTINLNYNRKMPSRSINLLYKLGIIPDISDPENYKKIKFLGKEIKESRLILILSTIGSLLILTIGLLFRLYENYISLSILIIVVYLVGGAPYMAYKYMEDKINENIIDNYPYFLSQLSDSISSGLSIVDALNYTSNLDFGYLSRYVRKLYSWLKWGLPFEKAFTLFNLYFYDLPDIRRTNYVILESYIGGGDLSKSLKRIYTDLENSRDLDKLRKSYVSQQVMVLYSIYVIFIGLMISILNTIQPLINSQLIAATVKSSFSLFSSSINYGWLKFISGLSIILVGISVSITSGIAESGKFSTSMKHLAINVFIGLLAVIIFILPTKVNFTLDIYPTNAYIYNPITIQIYGSANSNPLNNVPVTLSIVGINTNYQSTQVFILNNGFYSYSTEFNQSGEYLVDAKMRYQGKLYNKDEYINVTI